jgi:hypothetical protein
MKEGSDETLAMIGGGRVRREDLVFSGGKGDFSLGEELSFIWGNDDLLNGTTSFGRKHIDCSPTGDSSLIREEADFSLQMGDGAFSLTDDSS